MKKYCVFFVALVTFLFTCLGFSESVNAEHINAAAMDDQIIEGNIDILITDNPELLEEKDTIGDISVEQPVEDCLDEISNDRSSIIESGVCGKNITWTLDDNGVLLISGKGEMYDYYDDERMDENPWSESYFYKIKEIVISEGITSTGNCAFYEFPNLKNVTLPSTLKRIGNKSFGVCSYDGPLSNIDIPSGVTSIGSFAFSGQSLTSVTLPKGLKTMGSNAFMYNKIKNITIPGSLTTIPDGAFYDNPLENITISKGVKSIGKDAFSYCEMSSIDIPGSVEEICAGAFSFNVSLQSVSFNNGLKSIGAEAFVNCNIRNLILPGSLRNMGMGAFENCKELKTVTFEKGITQIGYFDGNDILESELNRTSHYFNGIREVSDSGVFQGCTSLSHVKIPSGVTHIGRNTFNGCALESVSLPKSLLYISDGAFGCNYSNYNIIVPKSVEEIGSGAFSDGNIYYEGSENDWYKIKHTKKECYDDDNINNTIVKTTILNYDEWRKSNGYIERFEDPLIIHFNSNIPSTEQYAVTFISDDNIIDQQKVNKNDKATEISPPQKEAYVFEAWYEDSGFTKLYNFSSRVTKDLTLYAKWIKYTAENGTGASGSSLDVSSYLNPSNEKGIRYRSDDSKIASVTSKGIVKCGKKAGTTTITAYKKIGKKEIMYGIYTITNEVPKYFKNENKDKKNIAVVSKGTVISPGEMIDWADMTLRPDFYEFSDKKKTNFDWNELSGEVIVKNSGSCKVTAYFGSKQGVDKKNAAKFVYTINSKVPFIKDTSVKPNPIKNNAKDKVVTVTVSNVPKGTVLTADSWKIFKAEKDSETGKMTYSIEEPSSEKIKFVAGVKGNFTKATVTVAPGTEAQIVAVVVTIEEIDYPGYVSIQ